VVYWITYNVNTSIFIYRWQISIGKLVAANIVTFNANLTIEIWYRKITIVLEFSNYYIQEFIVIIGSRHKTNLLLFS